MVVVVVVVVLLLLLGERKSERRPEQRKRSEHVGSPPINYATCKAQERYAWEAASSQDTSPHYRDSLFPSSALSEQVRSEGHLR